MAPVIDMLSDDAHHGTPGTAHAIEQIAVDLQFELGTLRMSVGELSRLRAGQSMRLGTRLQEQPVRIVAGGTLIGRGELAALGDELVVVVTEVGGLPML